MSEFNILKAREAQEKYCIEHKVPHFAPMDGICYKCHRNIYEEIEQPYGAKTGISVEKASKGLITGCPHCNRSYCD